MNEELDDRLHHGKQSVLPLLEGAHFVCEGVIVRAANLLDFVQILHGCGGGVSKELAVCLHPIDRRLRELVHAKHHPLIKITEGDRRDDT